MYRVPFKSHFYVCLFFGRMQSITKRFLRLFSIFPIIKYTLNNRKKSPWNKNAWTIFDNKGKKKANLFTRKGTHSHQTFDISGGTLFVDWKQQQKIGTSWNETSLIWTCTVRMLVHRFWCGIIASSSSSFFRSFTLIRSFVRAYVLWLYTALPVECARRANGCVYRFTVRTLFDSTGLMSIKC